MLWREVVGGVLVLAPGRTPAVLLSESGAAVWRIMEKPIGAEEIVREIASRYSVPSEVVAGDLAALLDDLEGRNLIQQVL